MFIPIDARRTTDAKGIRVVVFARPTTTHEVYLGEVRVNRRVRSLEELEAMDATLIDDAIRTVKHTPDYRRTMGALVREYQRMAA